MKQRILDTGSRAAPPAQDSAAAATGSRGPATAGGTDPPPAISLQSDPPQPGTAQPPMRVGLIDPYRFTRECLANAFSLLHRDLVVLPFVTVADCVAPAQPPLDLLAYYSHDDGPATEVILADLAELRRVLGTVPVVVLSDATSASEPELIRSMFRNGAQGFIPTQFTGIPVALAAIRFVQAGGTFAPLDLLLDGPPPAPAAPAAPGPLAPLPGPLTARQRAVLGHLRQGKANKNIAYDLGVSESTVKVHIKNIMRKMGATNRTQAVYKAQMASSSGAIAVTEAAPD